MPIYLNPALPRVDEHGAVKLEPVNGRPTRRRASLDTYACVSPREMVLPALLARVIEGYEVARIGVGRRDARPFCEVAVPAREAEVAGVVAAPEHLRNDVVHRKTHSQNSLLTPAVRAAKTKVSCYLSAQHERKTHASRLCEKATYVVSPPLEERRRRRPEEHHALSVALEALELPQLFGGQSCGFSALGQCLHPFALVQRNRPRGHTPQLGVVQNSELFPFTFKIQGFQSSFQEQPSFVLNRSRVRPRPRVKSSLEARRKLQLEFHRWSLARSTHLPVDVVWLRRPS